MWRRICADNFVAYCAGIVVVHGNKECRAGAEGMISLQQAESATGTLPGSCPLTVRLPAERVRAQAQHFAGNSELCTLIDAMPCVVLILNAHRQVIYANRRVVELLRDLGEGAAENFIGVRPGELLGCTHAFETLGGCGTSEACTVCGAAEAISTCEHGAAAVLECHILRERGGQALDLRVSTTPFHMGAAEYTILALTDIANEKRRQAMERIFYHDLLNMAGALQGAVQVMAQADPELCVTLSQAMLRTVTTLVEEIQAQRDLAAAENATLAVDREDLRTAGLIADVAGLYQQHSLAAQRQVVIDSACQDVTLRSDKRLLTRILGNMVKNALEASAPGQSVTVGCRQIDSEVELWVNNSGVMPEEAKLQVFQRSFSTKGTGRGLGTYSIKLLSEQYLGGSATFSSAVEGGTTFCVRLPQTPAE